MMITAEKIKESINSLPENEYIKLKKWFSEKDWKKWNSKLEQDSENGKLDFLIKEALNEKEQGTLKNV